MQSHQVTGSMKGAAGEGGNMVVIERRGDCRITRKMKMAIGLPTHNEDVC